jgi:hypothetical protein
MNSYLKTGGADMQVLISYGLAYIITAILIKDLPSFFQWFPLGLIFLILYSFFAAFFADSDFEENGDESRTDKKIHILRHRNDIRCEWNGCSIVFYEKDIVTARLNRDRNGNITAADYGIADGPVKSTLIHGSSHYFALINYKNSGIADENITWMRDNGSKYAFVHVEHGAFLNGPFEIYYSSGHIKKSGMLNHGSPDGNISMKNTILTGK